MCIRDSHYAGPHVQSVVVSHSYLNNRNTNYRQNDERIPENLMLRLRSTEQETKVRFENNSSFRNWKINLGVNLDYSQYTNTTFQKAYTCLLYTSCKQCHKTFEMPVSKFNPSAETEE